MNYHTIVAHLVPTGAPQSLQVMFIRLSEVSLSWTEVPCNQQNGPITGYVVQYYTTCGISIITHRPTIGRFIINEINQLLTKSNVSAFKTKAIIRDIQDNK